MYVSSTALALILLSGCLLAGFAMDLKNALDEINEEILTLRSTNQEAYSRNQKPHETCPKKILALVPQRFGIKDTRLFQNFEQTKQLLADITRELSITETLTKEFYVSEQFHLMMKFAETIMTEDVETLSKRRLIGLANICHQYDKYRTKPEATVNGEDEVKELKDKMVEAELVVVRERMQDAKEGRIRMNKFCNNRIKNVTEILTRTFTLDNTTDADVKETIRRLEKELETAQEIRQEKKDELFRQPQVYEGLKKRLEMKSFVLEHYQGDIDCYKKLKSAALKVQKPSFGHLLNFLN
uniref:Uncharacterized protein n=1 Tax=Graphocephala atropunctata TaxID=36148 RepID=A0A1B6MLE2_9HEMI